MGKKFSNTSLVPYDMNQDGKKEILVLKSSRNMEQPENSLIGFYNYERKVMYKDKKFEIQLCNETVFFDYDEDGIVEFLAVWMNGILEIRNINNEVVDTTMLGDKPGDIFFLSDLNSDGENEIIINGSNALYIFSTKLRLLARLDIPALRPQVIHKGRAKIKDLFVSNQKNFYHLTFKRNYSAIIQITYPLLLSFGCGFLFMLLVSVLNQRRKKMNLNYLIRQDYLDYIDRGVIVLDCNLKIITINNRAKKLLVFKDMILKGIQIDTVIADERYADLLSFLQQIRKNNRNRGEPVIFLSNINEQQELQISVTQIKSTKKQLQGFILHVDDITRYKHSEKVLSWAVIAQRLAHKIKTPMSSVMLAVQRLQMEYQKDSVKKANNYDQYINHVNTEIQKIRSATDDFMKLAQLDEPDLKPKNLNMLIKDCLEYNQNIFDKIQIVSELDEKLPQINIDDTQIRMVLQVLLDNSLEVMNRRGKLIISTRLIQKMHFEKESNQIDYAQIEIADTGHGIPKEKQQKILEPFFTTKKMVLAWDSQ